MIHLGLTLLRAAYNKAFLIVWSNFMSVQEQEDCSLFYTRETVFDRYNNMGENHRLHFHFDASISYDSSEINSRHLGRSRLDGTHWTRTNSLS
jgi:hypothetical protein